MNRAPHTLPLLVALVLLCFAGNSVLNRAAVAGGLIDPVSFAVLRVGAGALALTALLAWRDRTLALPRRRHLAGALSLSLYMVGFSLAYVALDSGVGALILFGGVQVVMFVGALLAREQVPPSRWVGATIALCGLAVLLWPQGHAAPSLGHGGLMALAALGWGVYSLIGRRAADPLGTTTASFVLSIPLMLILLLVPPLIGQPITASAPGAVLAIVSGVVTSGLGYALWYAVLPRLAAASAALLQLLVPVLATLGGIALLGEPPSLRLFLASGLVLGGVTLGVLGARRA